MSLLKARALTLTRIRHGKMDCVAEPRSGCATTVDACDARTTERPWNVAPVAAFAPRGG